MSSAIVVRRKVGIKVGIATSAVYFTVDNGVWKDSETTTGIYNQLINQASQYVGPYIDLVPLPDLPRTGSLVGTAQSTWNLGVKKTCKFLAASPTCAAGYVKRGYKYLEEQTREIVTSTNVPPAH